VKLGDMATVRSGLVLSRKLSRVPTKYRYPLLNLRSIAPEGYIDTTFLDVYDAIERLAVDYLTQKNDVVIRLSAPYTSVLIDDETNGMLISSNFVVIRTDNKSISAEYLFWLLNTSKVKRQIFENTSSNMLGAIKPKFFADFEIDLLPMEDQKKIAALNKLARRERFLLTALAREKEKYYATVIDGLQDKMIRRCGI
jgi:type I restriction modification DNA specificity domain